MPNLAFHALAAGRPLVTTPVGEIAEIVQREQVGVVMDAATPMAARRALERLTDAHYRVTLARQARYICQTKYHWQITADRLLAAYRSC
jgi:glycosyltransferase involved in cell wall biosynthesis